MRLLFSLVLPTKNEANETYSALFQNSAMPRPCLCLALRLSLRHIYIVLFLTVSAKNFRSLRLCPSLRVRLSAKGIALSVNLAASVLSKTSTSRRYAVSLLFSGSAKYYLMSAYSMGLSSALRRKHQLSQLMAVPALYRYSTTPSFLCYLCFGIAKYYDQSGHVLPSFSALIIHQNLNFFHHMAVSALSIPRSPRYRVAAFSSASS
jgi:hypothetical protein